MDNAKYCTSLSLKAEQVQNKSVQKYMESLSLQTKINEGKTVDRFDQSPLPNYPNFEPVRKGSN